MKPDANYPRSKLKERIKLGELLQPILEGKNRTTNEWMDPLIEMRERLGGLTGLWRERCIKDKDSLAREGEASPGACDLCRVQTVYSPVFSRNKETLAL